MKIDYFKDQYEFLSNFYICDVEYETIVFPSSEHAFQAAKDLDLEKRKLLIEIAPKPGQAKRKCGKRENFVNLRPGWDNVKDKIMYEIVKAKFEQNEDLKEKLLATGDVELIEGNWWKDYYWGVCEGKGLNKLGKILMRIRDESRKEIK